ncbi:lipopolysaccharide biosynthesis protein [Flavobacterium sp.]|uniref:lipopolysaccharide biosynthesis protein n=1 Tax=Flavobacterium sp. TaxID=239 RepID=UPI001B60EFBD|nr:lipopolysaccharide biosynthesis protein [Flavobacterium sp.]MBP6128165.1 lipopolysaccharide biosynthesis protein [Flavobacterium sp.]
MKEKLIKSAKWNGLGRLVAMVGDFTFGIILARLLLPSDFGVIAILTVFVSFLSVFVNSGFSQALIREKEVSTVDYSTVFYFNLSVAAIAFIISYFSAPIIANFYDNLEISLYLRVLSITLFIDAFILVQNSILTKNMDFKRLSIISISATIISGIIAICLAAFGFGIWSLVFKSLLRDLLVLIFTVSVVKWKPKKAFSIDSFKKYFKYGIYMLGSSLITQLYNNIFSLSVGKMFSPAILGYYNRAELFKNTLSQNIDSIITGVSYPALAQIQDNKIEFVNYYKNILQFSFYIISILMTSLFFNADALIKVLLGVKWIDSIIILKYLCLIGLFFPINSITVNSISVTGRSKIYFKFQLISIAGSLLSLVVGYYYGMIPMIQCFVIISFLLALWITHLFDNLFDFSMFELIKLLKNSFYNILLLTLVFYTTNIFIQNNYLKLTLNLVFGLSVLILLGSYKKHIEYNFIINQIIKVIRNNK